MNFLHRQYKQKLLKMGGSKLTEIRTALALQMELNNVTCTKYGYGYAKGIHFRMTEVKQVVNENEQ